MSGSRYVLGTNAARELVKLIRGPGSVSRRGDATQLAVENEFAAPYTVKWAQSASGGAGSWIIWLPSTELLTVGDEVVDVSSGLVAADPYPDGWFLLDIGVDIGAEASVYMRIERDEDDALDVSFVAERSDDGAFYVLVANLAVHDDGARVVRQSLSSAVVIGGECDVDDSSIDRNGGNDEDRCLQIAHFSDSEKDSSKGLATRLVADPETGEITARDSEGLMLIARKDGQVIYIPLMGDGNDPEPDPSEADPNRGCDDHPGGGEAVSPEGGNGVHGGYDDTGVQIEPSADESGFGAASCCE